MECPDGEQQTLGWFALVTYIPDPLARFLDELSVELAPGCNPRAHITVLPPRPHSHDLNDTVRRIADISRAFTPFRVEAGEIEIFNISEVVYLGIRRGAEWLHELYDALNHGELAFKEGFPYHPHITVAQDLQAGDASRLAAIAADKWARYRGPRGFEVTALSFVQHVAPSIWMDVAELPVGQLTLPFRQ